MSRRQGAHREDATVLRGTLFVLTATGAFSHWLPRLSQCLKSWLTIILPEEFWRAVATHGALNLHVICHYGRNTHHIIEGIFKAIARALREAIELDPRMAGVPSTKGVL